MNRRTPSRPDDAAVTDRRRHRSVTTRRKIADALLALLGEGVVQPTAEQVAARADVGLRTVFRHFEDMETLFRELIPAIDALILPVVQRKLTASTWTARLAESIGVLAPHYERLAIFYLATQSYRRRSPYLDAQARRYAALQRDMLRAIVPVSVQTDRPCFDALALVLSMDAWVHLRREQGLSEADAAAAMRRAAAALVGASSSR